MPAPLDQPRGRPDRAQPDRATRHARVAVAVLFAVNAVVLGSIVPWYPAIKADLALSNTSFGLAVAMGPLAALAIGVAAGPLIARLGSGRAAVWLGLAQLLALPIIGVAPTWLVLAAGIVVFGGADTITDAAMNAHGMRVQRRYRRSIINGFHALWSLGAVVGGLVASALVGAGVDRSVHLTGTAVVLGITLLVAARFLLPGPEHAERPDEATAGLGTSRGPGIRQAVTTATTTLAALGLMLVAAVMIEDVAASWSAIHLSVNAGAAPFVAGLGFVLAQAGMVVGRTMGDGLVDRLGAVTIARSGFLLGAAGLAIAALGRVPGVVLVGFALGGLGVATLYPLVMVAAGEIPGVRSGDGIAIASWLSRFGFLIGPPLIGVLADAVSLRVALVGVAVVALAGSTLSGLLRPSTPTPP